MPITSLVEPFFSIRSAIRLLESRRFRACLMNVRNKRGADIRNSLDQFLMVAMVADVPKNKNIVQRATNYCIERLKTPQVLGNFNAQISVLSTNLSSCQIGTTQHSLCWRLVGRQPRGRRKWMYKNTWMLIEERSKIKCIMFRGTWQGFADPA